MTDRLLNEEQKEAVEYGDGPLLIIAGAGTGKTTVITERIKHLILQKSITPSSILALTFTEKAANEMETRVDTILPYGYTQMWIQTFHGFCDRILRNEAVHIGLTPAYTLMTEAQSLLFLRKNLFSFDLDYFRPLGNPMKFLQGMLHHFSRLRDDDISPNDYLTFAKKVAKGEVRLGEDEDEDAHILETKKINELANAFKKYEELKAKEGVMDFSDLISNTLTLFRTRPNILATYQEKFKYILVDEFQDTNFAQNEMAILLAGSKHNIAVVGDDDQAIYRWRGAALANMMQFKSHFPKAKIITLTKNYRSTQMILDSAYDLIQHNNPYRLEVQEKIEKKLSGMRGEKGEPVELIIQGRADEEAEDVAKIIRDEAKNHGRKWSDVAILVRANDHAIPFQRALERAKIPYQFLGPGRLYQQEEIKDLIAYLHVLANFEDTASLYRVVTMPIFGIEPRDIAASLNIAKKKNICLFEALEGTEALPVSEATKEKITRIIAMIKKHFKLIPTETTGQILYDFFEESGLLGYYLDPRSQKTEKQAQNVAKFFERLKNYAAESKDASVFAVVDWIDLSMELGESPLAADIDWTENNAVNILTIHSSKGLEFPLVFVVNLVTNRFPSRDRKEQIPLPETLIKEQLPEMDENIAEERRLFYVAMTRAKDKLFLTAAKFYGEGRRERKLSPFIAESLGAQYVDTVLKRQKVEIAAQQLSLLEVLKPIVENKEEKPSLTMLPSEKNDTITPLTYISYSQIQTFQMCPLHYKLKYILKFPSSQSPALSFGITIHALLRAIYLQGFGKTTVDDKTLEILINKYWIGDGYASKQHEMQAKKSAKDLLLSYMKTNEHEIRLPIATELPFQFMLKNIKVMGRFDRIDQLDGNRIEIIDYKTGTNIPEEKKLKDDLQLTMYALAATQINDALFKKSPEEIQLTLYYIEKNKKLTTTRTKEQLEAAKEFILQKVEEIQTSEYACGHGIFCSNCEYKMLCQTFSN